MNMIELKNILGIVRIGIKEQNDLIFLLKNEKTFESKTVIC